MEIQIKSAALLLCAAVAFSSLCACSEERIPQYYENSYDTGTDVFSVHFAYDTMEKDEDGKKVYFTDDELNAIFADCCNIYTDTIAQIDHTSPSSQIFEINQQVNAVFDIDGEITALLKRANLLAEKTNGYYQPVFGSVTQLLQQDSHPDKALLDEALTHTGTDKITVDDASVYKGDPQAQVDLTALRSGYALEKIIAHLSESSIKYGFVTLGDSAGVFGTKADEKPFEIGVLSDVDKESIQGYVHAASGFVFVVSDELGGSVNYLTGETAKSDLTKVVVKAEDAVAADALAGALYAMGYDAGEKLYARGEIPFEAVFFMNDGSVKLTDGAYRAGLYEPALDKAKK